MVHRYPWSSQSHQRHILSPGTSARRDAPSTAVTTKRTTRRDGWSCSLNHCNSLTYHYHNYITKAITGLPPRRLLQTSRLHPGLHSTGGKKTILPSLLLLLRLLFLSAGYITHRQQSPELCTTGTSLRLHSPSTAGEDEKAKKSENKTSG